MPNTVALVTIAVMTYTLYTVASTFDPAFDQKVLSFIASF